MNKFETFAQFIATHSPNIPVVSFIINLIGAALLGYILSYMYVKFGDSLSNRKLFARNFVMMTMTTMIIISIVKSSLALSLGLVGALSIVRFRAAIKEPEELTYLFLAIAVGLGLGADQTVITFIGFVVVALIIWLRNFRSRQTENQNLVLTVTSSNPSKIELDKIINVLKNNCITVNLKRLDETQELLEAAFLVEFENFDKFNKGKLELQSLSKSIKIAFLDNRGLI
jgi:uncharacterized membrane protein